MLSPYRRVLSVPGALWFSLSALLGRLPIAMVSLGIVLLVEGATGSYGLAGTVSAAYLLANSVLAIPQGRLLDRFGQARVLLPAVAAFTVGLATMTLAVQAGWPAWAVYLAAAVAGGTLPQLGASVRARWTHVLDEPRPLQTAYAWESVADEAVFIVGPVLVTGLATLWHPVAGLVAAGLAGVVGTVAFAAQRRTEPPAPRVDPASGPAPAMPASWLVPLTGVAFALGALFGAAEVATVAFADERGRPAAAGILLGLWSLGSLLSGILTGVVHWRRPTVVRLRVAVAALAAALAPLFLVDSIPVMAVALFVGGFAISPSLIAAMSLLAEVVPAGRLTEGMTVLGTGIAAGLAPGAALAGLLIDAYGASVAYLLPFGAGVLAALAGLMARGPRRGTPSALPGRPQPLA